MEDENFFEKCRTCQHCYTKMMTIMFIAGKEMKNVNINHAKKNTASGKNGFGQKQNRRIICQE